MEEGTSNPFLAEDRAKRLLAQREVERARKAREDEERRLEAERLSRRRCDAMVEKGKSLTSSLKEKERQMEQDALERLQAATLRAEEQRLDRLRAEEAAKAAIAEEKRKQEAAEEAERERQRQRQLEKDKIIERRMQATQARHLAFSDSEKQAERRAQALVEVSSPSPGLTCRRKSSRSI